MLASGQYRIYPTPPQPGPTSKVIHVNLPNTLKKRDPKVHKVFKVSQWEKSRLTISGDCDWRPGFRHLAAQGCTET